MVPTLDRPFNPPAALADEKEPFPTWDVGNLSNNSGGTLMRTLLLAGALAVAGFAIATPISIAPASAQVAVDTPIGGVRVGPQPRYYRDYDRPAYRAYGYDRGYRGCRTVTIERDDGSVRRVRRCD
jgi:hypothetical protein